MKTLDFIIIGAQKCATTTLFELLRQHPEVSMPLEKEVPFFHQRECDAAAWSAFADQYYPEGENKTWGKASPQYMADEAIPARIAALMPGTRLIAVLRDPIDRSRSHFRMALRRNTETRSFDEAMRDRLTPEALETARQGTAPTHRNGYEPEGEFYLAWSEYGRILTRYRQHFSEEQMLILYTDELENDPRGVLTRVLKFLDLGTDFQPRGLGEVMHAGGGGARVPHGLRVWLRERTLIAAFWNRVPPQQQGRIRFLYERWNSRKRKDPLPLHHATEQALRQHFARDAELIESLGIPSPPWSGDYKTA
ncbi:sulfotransferase family protein [Congregibacter litoralis]|uniref:Sulfotransferase family n=1 Tax=Congregibacter litoralis KT71 TaxID=314285 RepID=A4AB89_9GAMM|nr:sulfotransferase [Congregibacter litoralis]EAQ96643.1 Sulfotransferase family [Congregibacter litoralis KT71]